MPKLQSPFIRNDEYIVTPEIDPDYAWVFEDEGVTCQEKLDGTNVSIIIENGKLTRVFNRVNDVDMWSDCPVIEGVREAYNRGYCNFTDGQYFGEVVGEKIQGNPHKIEGHIWLPYETYFRKHLTYKTWGQYPKDFDTISKWFEEGLLSLYGMQKHGGTEGHFCEGVVFHHPDGRMAKLRRDMFDWYKGVKHKRS